MRAFALALVALLLAGCAGDAPPDASVTPPPVAAISEAVAAPPPGLEVVAFSQAPIDKTTWHNGSFRVTQASRPANEVPRLVPPPEDPRIVVDVTGDLPRDAPALIVAEVNAEVGRGDIDLFLDASSETRRSGRANGPYGGFTHAEWRVVHRGEGRVLVTLEYDVAAETADVPYSLMVRIVTHPQALPSALAVGILVPEGATNLTAHLMGERLEPPFFEPERAQLMLWDPSDAFVGAFPLNDSGNTVIPLPSSASGEYAAILSQGGRSAMVFAAPGATMRALNHVLTVSDFHAGQSPTLAEWSYTYDRVPILAGIVWSVGTAAQDTSARHEGPGGLLFDAELSGGPWVSVNAPEVGMLAQFVFDGGFGVEGLGAGEYKARVTFGQAASADPIQVAEYAFSYSR